MENEERMGGKEGEMEKMGVWERESKTCYMYSTHALMIF